MSSESTFLYWIALILAHFLEYTLPLQQPYADWTSDLHLQKQKPQLCWRETSWTNSLLISLMPTTDGETITNTRARYYISIFYKYDSAHIVFTSTVFLEGLSILAWLHILLDGFPSVLNSRFIYTHYMFFPDLVFSTIIQILTPWLHYILFYFNFRWKRWNFYVTQAWLLLLHSHSNSSGRKVISNVLKIKCFYNISWL